MTRFTQPHTLRPSKRKVYLFLNTICSITAVLHKMFGFQPKVTKYVRGRKKHILKNPRYDLSESDREFKIARIYVLKAIKEKLSKDAWIGNII